VLEAAGLYTPQAGIKGTRFLIAYTVGSDRLVILAVYHSVRRWPVEWLRAHVEKSLKQGENGQFAFKKAII
jgi:hypothetical protein